MAQHFHGNIRARLPLHQPHDRERKKKKKNQGRLVAVKAQINMASQAEVSPGTSQKPALNQKD
jgi:hypothetical protein